MISGAPFIRQRLFYAERAILRRVNKIRWVDVHLKPPVCSCIGDQSEAIRHTQSHTERLVSDGRWVSNPSLMRIVGALHTHTGTQRTPPMHALPSAKYSSALYSEGSRIIYAVCMPSYWRRVSWRCLSVCISRCVWREAMCLPIRVADYIRPMPMVYVQVAMTCVQRRAQSIRVGSR